MRDYTLLADAVSDRPNRYTARRQFGPGDVISADLDGNQGREIGNNDEHPLRTCIVLTPVSLDHPCPMGLVAPVRDAEKAIRGILKTRFGERATEPMLYPGWVYLPAHAGGLLKDSIVLLPQLRSLDLDVRIRGYYGCIDGGWFGTVRSELQKYLAGALPLQRGM